MSDDEWLLAIFLFFLLWLCIWRSKKYDEEEEKKDDQVRVMRELDREQQQQQVVEEHTQNGESENNL